MKFSNFGTVHKTNAITLVLTTVRKILNASECSTIQINKCTKTLVNKMANFFLYSASIKILQTHTCLISKGIQHVFNHLVTYAGYKITIDKEIILQNYIKSYLKTMLIQNTVSPSRDVTRLARRGALAADRQRARPARQQCYRRRQTDASKQNNTGPLGGPVVTLYSILHSPRHKQLMTCDSSSYKQITYIYVTSHKSKHTLNVT